MRRESREAEGRAERSSIKLRRMEEGGLWRIESPDFLPFLAHLERYFMWDEPFRITRRKKISHGEIGEREFCLISELFAAQKMAKNELEVREIYPRMYVPTWEDTLTLHLYVETNYGLSILVVHLKVRIK